MVARVIDINDRCFASKEKLVWVTEISNGMKRHSFVPSVWVGTPDGDTKYV